MASLEAIHVARLEEALAGRRCVSAWLGYGEVLFLGLGGEILPSRDQDGKRSKPPVELQTSASDWSIEPPLVSSSSAERPDLEAAASRLVGQSVVEWQMLEANGLRIIFANERVLSVRPWSAEKEVSDAWNLESPDGRVLAVSTDGRAVVVDSSQPIRDWFV